MVCLTPKDFWPASYYEMSEAPSLSAQSACYVAKVLSTVAERWGTILDVIENIAGDNELSLKNGQVRGILTDDDAFTRSKKYFWGINVIHEALKLLDDSIEQWIRYQRTAVAPWKRTAKTGREAYWFDKSQEVLAAAEKRAEGACSELRMIRKEFQEALERIIIMRDGVCNSLPSPPCRLHSSLTDAAALQRQRGDGVPRIDPARQERQAPDFCQHLLPPARILRGRSPPRRFSLSLIHI